MTTFVLCNECGNRWKVCIFLPPPSPHHPQMLPHIRNSKPTAKKGLTGLCRVDLQSWRSWWVVIGEAGRECTGMCVFWKVPGWDGSSSHISSEDGQVPHLSTEGVSCSTPHHPVPHRKTTALSTWTTLLYKALSQMLFPLNLATPGVRKAEVCQRGLSRGAPRSSSLPKAAPFPRQPWKSSGYPRLSPGLPRLLRRQRFCFQT